MQIDLRTVNIEPVRKTFDHLARRFGDKPASRYQEGSYDLQATENLHYRPTWDPDQALYDPNLSRIRMQDWYALKDPRQFYYSTYTLARARQQENMEANFSFVEERGLHDMLSAEIRQKALDLLIPLRHAAWGGNQNNALICGYGFGVVFTQPCIYHAMDNLGISQYLSRLGLLLGGTEALHQAKQSWMNDSSWQPLRRLVEDSMGIRDPFEVFVLQNVVLDGLLYPLVYERIVDDYLSSRGGQAVAMLTQFMPSWFTESKKWTTGVLKVAAAESPENAAVLAEWIKTWSDRVVSSLIPVLGIVIDDNVDEMVCEELEAFHTRIKAMGIPL